MKEFSYNTITKERLYYNLISDFKIVNYDYQDFIKTMGKVALYNLYKNLRLKKINGGQ